MAMPISLGECLDLVDRAVRVYKKIKHEVPEFVTEVADRIKSLRVYLKGVRDFLKDDNILVRIRPNEKKNLADILDRMSADVSNVTVILEKWREIQKLGALAKTFHQAKFAYGSSPKELEALGKRLDQRYTELQGWKDLLSLWGQVALLDLATAASQAHTPEPQSACNILIVDPNNTGRSVQAEAHALLAKEWTVRTGGNWPINYIHSAGLLVKSRSGIANLQQQLGMEMTDGNKPPVDAAMSALFDNLPFTYDYKNEIRTRLSQRRSRGLTENMFAAYDFILLFNRHNIASLEVLRDALAKKHGQPTPAGKGKLVLLGEYSTTGNKQIFNPKKGPDGQESLENWAMTAAIIRTSLYNFLKRELAWVRPAPGATQDV